MAPITLFPFRYRHERTGKWVRARYVATREEIATRYAEWEIIGEPELRADELPYPSSWWRDSLLVAEIRSRHSNSSRSRRLLQLIAVHQIRL